MKKLMEIISKQFKDSELLTEEVKTEIKSELEKLINEKVEISLKEKTDILEESYNQKLATLTEEGQRKLDEYVESHSAKVNEYVTEAVNEWLENNELQMEAGIKVERATKVIEGLKELLNENDITITEDKNDIVAKLETDIQALKSTNETLIEGKSEVEKQCFEYEKVISFNKIAKDLTDIQREEVVRLNEGVISKTIKDFERNIKIMINKVKDKNYKINEDNKDISESLTRNSGNKIGNGKADMYL